MSIKTLLRQQVEAFRIASKLSPFNHWLDRTTLTRHIRLIPLDRMKLCATLCIEEPIETLEAMGADPEIIAKMKELADKAVASIDLERADVSGIADGLGDSDYVNEWTRLELGIDGVPIADEIQKANMAKFGPGSYFHANGKVQKPPGWTPPNIDAVMLEQGWTK